METKDQSEKRKQNPSMEGFKRGLTGKIATSSLGKSMITKNTMNDRTKKLVSSLKNVVNKVYCSKTATKVENGLIKLFIKAKSLANNDLIQISDLKDLDQHVRAGFKLSVKISDNIQSKRIIPPELLSEWIQSIQKSLEGAKSSLAVLIGPHLSDKAMDLVAFLFSIFVDEKFLRAFLTPEPELVPFSDSLTYAMEQYLSFNLH